MLEVVRVPAVLKAVGGRENVNNELSGGSVTEIPKPLEL